MPSLGEPVEEPVRQAGRVDQRLVGVDHADVPVDVDRPAGHRHDEQLDAEHVEHLAQLPGALLVAAKRRAVGGEPSASA